jgi:hypothetical protein
MSSSGLVSANNGTLGRPNQRTGRRRTVELVVHREARIRVNGHVVGDVMVDPFAQRDAPASASSAPASESPGTSHALGDAGNVAKLLFV